MPYLTRSLADHSTTPTHSIARYAPTCTSGRLRFRPPPHAPTSTLPISAIMVFLIRRSRCGGWAAYYYHPAAHLLHPDVTHSTKLARIMYTSSLSRELPPRAPTLPVIRCYYACTVIFSTGSHPCILNKTSVAPRARSAPSSSRHA